MRRSGVYSRPSEFQPSVRFPSTSGFMGAVPPPAQLTAPNAAAISAGLARDVERRKEEEYDALMSSGGKSTTGKPGGGRPRKKKIYDDE
ncbi:unnamed protein product [Gongylonema pulchrum]|uniref:Uncharacterized protein n=1 Tax=Gongylonema pulchrum TaxID=637853 RepID=A0A183EWP8_9BILA|nr:unnamed protein product [Gongylonema pulchrum]